MTSTTPSKLDDQELLHLAIRASGEGRHDLAIDHLKRALELAPNNAKALYMLGAEHAEIGMYERAVEDMAKAVKLDPTLVTAHFQLGLLYVTSGRVVEAEEAWKPLDNLGANHPLYLFKTGMLHLVKDEFDACIEALEKGLRLNQQNDALNNDMRRVLEDVKARSGKTVSAPSPDAPAVERTKVRDVRLSAYRQTSGEKE